jgi:hypothetical protein
MVGEAGLGLTAQVEDDFQQQALMIEPLDRSMDVRRQRLEEQLELSGIGIGKAVG